MTAGNGIAYNIPMQSKLQIPDIPGALARGNELKQQQIETDDLSQQHDDQQADRMALTEYTKSGGDLYTPAGIEKAKADLRGKVSFSTYDKINQQAEKVKAHDLDMRQKIADFNTTETKNFLDKNNAVLGALVPLTEAYKADVAAKGEVDANANFEANRAAKLKELSQAKGADGQPLFAPEQIQQFAQMDPQHLAGAVALSKPYHDLAETKWKESQTQANEARAKKDAVLATKAAALPESDKLHLRELDALHAQGLISDELYERTKTGLLDKATGGAATAGSGAGFTPEGQAYFDKMVASGNAPPGSFRSKSPSPILVDTINRLAKTEADPNQDKAGFAADNASLRKLVPQYDAVKAFEENTAQQGQVLKQLATKVDKTGVPVVERWIRAGRQQIEGDEDVNVFNAQLQLYASEAAKILTNPNLTGQLSDTARAEVKAFLPGSATAKQISAVVDRLTNDFALREKSIEDQIAVVNKRIKDRGEKANTPKSGEIGPNSPGAKVAPTDQKTRDSDAIEILTKERDEEADKMSTAKDQATKDRIQSNIDALEREIAKARKKAGGAAAPAPAAKKAKVYDPATGTFK